MPVSDKPSGAEVSKRLGELWKELGDNEKGKYEKIRAKAMLKYFDEMRKYQPGWEPY